MGFYLLDPAAPAEPPGPLVEWEETSCLLCGSERWSQLVEAPDTTPGGTGLWFVVVQCQECGLCFTNPRPNRQTQGQFYPPRYSPHHPPSLKRRQRRARPARDWHRPGKERRVLPWHGQGRLLDFGCGGGSFLDRMNRQGSRVMGVETSPVAVQRLRSELGLPAVVGSLPHPALRPASFDVVTMWQSLEHVHDPLEVLRQAHRLLVPGGKLLVAVPNIDSLAFRWFGHAWYGLDLPRHLVHFAPWTLHLMLERAGFRVGPIRMVRHSHWLRSSAHLAGHYPRGPHWHRWLRSKPTSRLATWYSYLTYQADCIMVTADKPGN